jgi:hypothetical protein
MCGHIRQSAADPYVQRLAGELWNSAGRAGTGDPIEDLARTVWLWAKLNIRFVLDEIQLGQLLNRQATDFLISPSVMVRRKRKQGDCDCFSMMIAALLTCMGVPWRICTVKCDSRDSARWSHVYLCVDLSSGARLPLDASHGKYCGWEVPARDVTEYAEWDCNGSRLPTRLAPVPMGSYAPARLPLRSWGMGACGDCLDITDTGDGCVEYDTTGCAVAPTGSTSTSTASAISACGGNSDCLAALYNSTAPAPGSDAFSNPLSSAGINPNILAGDISSLLGQVTKTVGGLVSPMVTYRLPNGTIVTAPAGSVAGTALTSSVGGFSGSTLLLMGGAALLLLVMLGKGH